MSLECNHISCGAFQVVVTMLLIIHVLVWCVLCSLLLRRLLGCRIVGITGGIACGKSALVRAMHRIAPSAPVIDMDLVARDVCVPGAEGSKLEHTFPM